VPPNDGHEYRERLGATAAGLALVDYLSARYAHSSRDEWRERILAGRVLLDALPASPETPVRAGQLLTWLRPAWDEPEVPGEVALLYEDSDLLAVDKPAGLPTLPGAGYLVQTLLARVRERDPAASPVHRLGRWTSGIVLFARTAGAAADLARQHRAGTIVKRYRALATGAPARDAFTIHDPIGPVPHPLLGRVHAATPSGRIATTHVEVIERRDGLFLAGARIETGRPHQIRIHLAAAGHPLAGDPLYLTGGVPAPDSRAVPGDPGYHLHAEELGFHHPRTGEPLWIRSSPPPILCPGR
jgi:23S rRNA pseudouridine1911/1915/1917 synthase